MAPNETSIWPASNYTHLKTELVLSEILSFYYVSSSFYKHTTETNTPDPAPDDTQGESVIFCKPRDNQAPKLLEIPNKTKKLFLLDKMFAF